ncbi:MAG: hypothetical protein IRZ33_07470 [Alicyclobacillaceae bacterium]|nr:hypothetical protein [Alicyclobacillaceae bacterium]
MADEAPTNRSSSARAVRLQPLTAARIHRLWQAGAGDPHWPLADRSERAFRRLAEEAAAAEAFGCGWMRAVETSCGDKWMIAGLVTARIPDTEWLPTGVTACECGTYLLPPFRGTGIHVSVKDALLELCWDTWDCEWCLFVVPVSNPAARRALAKLPWPVRRSGSDAGTPDFARLGKRRAWETGEACEVFAVRRNDWMRLDGRRWREGPAARSAAASARAPSHGPDAAHTP